MMTNVKRANAGPRPGIEHAVHSALHGDLCMIVVRGETPASILEEGEQERGC